MMMPGNDFPKSQVLRDVDRRTEVTGMSLSPPAGRRVFLHAVYP